MTKKRLIIIGSIFAILLVIILVVKLQPTTYNLKPNTTPTPSSPPNTLPKPTIPKGPTFRIQNTTVKNFYEGAKEVKPDGEVRVEETAGYHIIYEPGYNYFLLSIVGSPFSTYRLQAETALLKQLNIPPSQACQLNVDITTPRSINPKEAGITYKLSFCK